MAAPAADTPAGMARLQDFLDDARTLRATFRQDVLDGDGKVTETSTGVVAMVRPGRFRWDYQQPYERAVVADGRELWLYEADLQQVTVRPLAAGLGETPAALLTGGREVLQRFEFVSAWSGEDLAWVRLRPRAADADFESVTIGFAGNRPERFELRDRLGQTTRIAFSGVRLNVPVEDGIFRFRVPDGVDVIREGAP